MSRSDREGWNQLTWLFKFARIRICQCAALSVICFANASSPKGRAEKPVRAESLTNRGSSDTDLFVCCSFRHGLRRATFLREEGFGFPRKPNLSLPPGEMSRSDREGWNQLTWLFRFALIRICQCAALSVICFANASSPKERAEKPVRAESLTNQGDFDTDLFVCCSFRHSLRRATFLREEGFGFPRKPNLSLPPGEMSRSDREGWNQLTWLFRFALIRTCQCAAISVICFANASSPKGRAEKPVQAESLTNQGDFDTDLFVCCSFRHGLRRATFLREEGFGESRHEKTPALNKSKRFAICAIRMMKNWQT